MTNSFVTRRKSSPHTERGGSRLNFLIAVVVLAALGYTAYQYVPVAYHAFLFRDRMQEIVNIAAGSGKSPQWVEVQLRASAAEHGAPPDAMINVQRHASNIQAQVRWTRPIPLLGHVYQYNFDHTVRSSAFLSQ